MKWTEFSHYAYTILSIIIKIFVFVLFQFMNSENGNVANRDLALTKQRMYNLFFNNRM